MSTLLSKRWFLHVAIVLESFASVVFGYKYFDEPGGAGLEHYDARYFRGRVSEADRAQTLSELIVAFNDIMEAEGIVTWLAHGTLLGWYWNGQTLPWDWDLDMQVDVTSLQTLAEEYNSTIWTALPANAGHNAVPRDYLLDVNPYWMERVHGDGANFIDARFIDTRNGLYVDITGLTELDPNNLPNVVSCKNYHNYRLEDIYPLRETLFEGAKAKVPYKFKTILDEEYGPASLVQANYNGFVWVRQTSEWIEMKYKGHRVPPKAIPATPPTRIIPDEELYNDGPAPPKAPSPKSPVEPPIPGAKKAQPIPTTLAAVASSEAPGSQGAASSIELEVLPADSIESSSLASNGNFFSTFWEFITLYW